MDAVAVLLTADSVRDQVEGIILSELVAVLDSAVLLRRYLRIEKGKVKDIYPKLVDKPLFSALVHNLTSGLCLFAVIQGEYLFPRIKEVKGFFRIKEGRIVRTGLRQKYCGLSVRELQTLGYHSKQLFYRSFEFRLHTTDTQEETLLLCKLILSVEDLTNLTSKITR